MFPVWISLAFLSCLSRISAQDLVKCGKDDSVSSAQYQVVTNAWNGSSGTQCLSITSDATAYNATWMYPVDRTQTHAYPHVKFLSKALPIALSSLTSLTLKADWDYDVSSSADMYCNVALDMFADPDPVKARNETLAQYEIMVWWGLYGNPVPAPLGFSDEPRMRQTVNNIDFSLYVGMNKRGVNVLTWIAGSTIKNIDIDVLPLIQALKSIITGNDVLLGTVQLGSEAFYATENVTFQVSNYSLDIEPSPASKTTPSSSGSSSSGSSSSSTSAPKKGGSERLLPQLSIIGLCFLAYLTIN